MYENNSYEPLSKPTESMDYLQVLWRRKWSVLFGLIVAVSAAVLFNRFSTPVYEAVATIIYGEPNSKMLIAENGQLSLHRTAIINLVEQLKSRALAEELAQALPEQIIQRFKASTPRGANISHEDLIVRRLQKSLDIVMVPNSDILKIKVKAKDPVTAKIIADTYIERIVEWNLRMKQDEISGIRDFVEKQLAVFQNKLNGAEDALRAFKEQNRMLSLNEASAELLRRTTDAEVAYNEVKSQREALEQRRHTIEEKKQQLAPSYIEASGSTVQYLKRKLMGLEVQYSDLQIKGQTSNQQQMRTIKQGIDDAKEQLIQQLLNTAQRENLSDPTLQFHHLLQESVGLEVDLETYKAREQVLKNIMANYGEEMQALPDQELQLARLIRERDVSEKIYSMLLAKREEARIAEAAKAGNVKLIDAAQVPLAPVAPEKLKNLVLSIFLGLGIGVVMGFFLESSDTTLKSQADVEKHVDIPVLTLIPAITPNGRTKRNGALERSYHGRLLSQLEAGSHTYEAYRTLHFRFAMVNKDRFLKSILVTSPDAADGKTLTAINMAQVFARSGIKTLLVDCDLRHPMVHRIFGIKREPGLSDLLRNRRLPLEKAAKAWAVQMRSNKNFSVFTCGTMLPNPYEILSAARMRQLLAEFKRQYDLVILDSPPLMMVTDSIVLGGEVDGVCLVIRSGRTSREAARRAKQLLNNSRTNVIGAILNEVDVKNHKPYYQGAYCTRTS